MAMKHIDEPIYWAPTKKLGGGWIAHKDSPSAPTPPDPTVVANAQTASNLETARTNAQLNRVNQYTPWGSLTYSQTATPDSFDQQGYDNAMQAYQQSLQNYQQQQATPWNAPWETQRDGAYQVSGPTPPAPTAPTRDQFTTHGNADTWNSTITLSPEQQALLDSSNRISQSMANLGENQIANVNSALSRPLDLSGAPAIQNNALQTSVSTPGAYQSNVGYGQIQNNVDTSNLNPLQTNASYGNIQDRLDTSGVPALIGGDRLAQDLQTQRDSLYNQQAAYLDPQWQARQHDLENQLTQQGVMQNSDAWNRAMDDLGRQRTFDYNQARQSAITGGGAEQSRLFNIGLASNQNAFNQALNSGNFANSAQAQGFGQALSNANLNNAANAQQFGQNATAMQLANAAQAQGFGQNLANAQLNNNVRDNTFNQGLMNAQLNNAASNQAFNQSSSARNQNINELLMQQQNPLNVLNALRTGSQVSSPQFSSSPQVAMANTDVMSPINNQFNAQMGAYNSQVSQNNALTGGLFQLGGAALGAPAGTFASLAAAF